MNAPTIQTVNQDGSVVFAETPITTTLSAQAIGLKVSQLTNMLADIQAQLDLYTSAQTQSAQAIKINATTAQNGQPPTP